MKKDIITHLVIEKMVQISFKSVSDNERIFTIKKAKYIIFKFGMLPPKKKCITLKFH